MNTKKKNAGQALIEYVLMIAIVAMSARMLYPQLKKLLALLEKPIRKDFKYTYKYGDPDTCSFGDDEDPCFGEPVRHPKFNNRMFGRRE
jgi:hypothetical protein